MPVCDKEGAQIPATNFHVFKSGAFEQWNIAELVKGKTVVIFGLPGAFTPTCSSSHLPRYDELYPVLKQNGVDDVYCVSVNDSFVMNSWADAHRIKHVKMLPDGNGEFSQAMGLAVDKSEIGFGQRSWRYSMLIKNGIIVKLFLEPEEGADPYGKSDADTMLHFINPKAESPHRIAILSKPGCPFCVKVKSQLNTRGLGFVDISLPDWERAIAVGAITGSKTVPQVFVDGKLIGGADDFEKWLAKH